MSLGPLPLEYCFRAITTVVSFGFDFSWLGYSIALTTYHPAKSSATSPKELIKAINIAYLHNLVAFIEAFIISGNFVDLDSYSLAFTISIIVEESHLLRIDCCWINLIKGKVDIPQGELS